MFLMFARTPSNLFIVFIDSLFFGLLLDTGSLKALVLGPLVEEAVSAVWHAKCNSRFCVPQHCKPKSAVTFMKLCVPESCGVCMQLTE